MKQDLTDAIAVIDEEICKGSVLEDHDDAEIIEFYLNRWGRKTFQAKQTRDIEPGARD